MIQEVIANQEDKGLCGYRWRSFHSGDSADGFVKCIWSGPAEAFTHHQTKDRLSLIREPLSRSSVPD